jgi:hypothetical protein
MVSRFSVIRELLQCSSGMSVASYSVAQAS